MFISAKIVMLNAKVALLESYGNHTCFVVYFVFLHHFMRIYRVHATRNHITSHMNYFLNEKNESWTKTGLPINLKRIHKSRDDSKNTSFKSDRHFKLAEMMNLYIYNIYVFMQTIFGITIAEFYLVAFR